MFSSNEIVLCMDRNPNMLMKSTSNWYKIILRSDVCWGHSMKMLILVIRSFMVLQLAEKYYKDANDLYRRQSMT